MATKFIQCGNCKKPVTKGVKRCPYCGAKIKRHGCLKTLLVLFVLAAVVVLAGPMILDATRGEPLNLASYRLGNALPTIEAKKGEVHTDNDDHLRITVFKVTDEERNAYINACKAEGFTIESESLGSGYTAYNQEGYKLDISSYGSSGEMNVNLEAPMKLGALQWPQSDLAKRIPTPDSMVGQISWEREDGFYVYVGETPMETYNAYVQACVDAGFTVDYNKGEHFYRAEDSDGCQLSIEYEGFNTMTVRLEAPDDEQQTAEATAAPTAAPAPAAPTAAPVPAETGGVLVNGMRPEVKDALDAYEAFFDEYVAFMKKYESSSNTASMLLDYAKYMSEYAETMEKFDAMGDDDLNDAELTYYLQVQTRINQKLLEAAQ